MSRIPTALAVLAVLAAYAFVGSGGTFSFPRLSDSGYSYYADLAEGFRQGHLYLAHAPDQRLAALPNPWDFKAREGIHYAWDASYFNGRYYLYFSPLPALIFYLPHRLLRGAYPPDALAVTLFSAWAFIAAVVFVRRAIGRISPLWILLIGLGNVIPYVLTDPAVYEVPIAAAMAMTCMWALALLSFVEAPSVRRAAMIGLWLGLAIACRPNLGVLLFVTAAVLLRSRWKTIAVCVAPLAVIAIAMVSYNVARFGDPFEFGVRYQLTHVDMAEYRVCGVSSFAEVGRLVNHALHYVFWSPVIRSTFPFVDLTHAKLDRAVTWPTPTGLTQHVAGIAPLIPLTIVGTLFAILLLLSREPRNAGTRTAMFVLAGGWLVLFGLSSCWWVVTRYALDFMLLIVIASLVCIEAGLVQLRAFGLRIAPLRVLIAILACWSILIGSLLGFVGPGDAFERVHPEMFRRVQSLFHQ